PRRAGGRLLPDSARGASACEDDGDDDDLPHESARSLLHGWVDGRSAIVVKSAISETAASHVLQRLITVSVASCDRGTSRDPHGEAEPPAVRYCAPDSVCGM